MGDGNYFQTRNHFSKDHEVWESTEDNSAGSKLVKRKLLRMISYQLDRAVKLIQEHLRRSLATLPIPPSGGFRFL